MQSQSIRNRFNSRLGQSCRNLNQETEAIESKVLSTLIKAPGLQKNQENNCPSIHVPALAWVSIHFLLIMTPPNSHAHSHLQALSSVAEAECVAGTGITAAVSTTCRQFPLGMVCSPGSQEHRCQWVKEGHARRRQRRCAGGGGISVSGPCEMPHYNMC